MPPRIKIPTDLSNRLLFEFNRTCCVCQTPGKSPQIHHIDLDPSNNDYENLIVLCLECHNDVHTKNAFGKNWNPSLLKKYKVEWIERIRLRKLDADKAASLKSIVGTSENGEKINNLEYKSSDSLHLLKMYLEKLPTIHRGQMVLAESEWIHPSPHGMVLGFSKMIDFYEAVLVELSTFYPKGHFDNKDPRDFFSEQISMRTSFSITKLAPFGGYIGYATDRDVAIESLSIEIRGMVAQLVEQLLTNSYEFDLGSYEDWAKDWNKDYVKE